MPILIKRKSGEITPLKNGEYLPAYYFIPKEILQQCGAELNSLPRNPVAAVNNWDAITLIESDLFLNLIIDAYAFMVWPFMGLGAKREIYSGFEPSWILAHSAGYWVQELTDEKIIPTASEFLKNVQLSEQFGFVFLGEISDILRWLVPQAMARHNMNAAVETAKEFRCFEDFDYRTSRQKTDFYRRWYHTRTEHPQISLESWQEYYKESHDGQEWDVTNYSTDVELNFVDDVQVEQFMSTLSDKDKQILKLRIEGRTLEEIADKLGYQNHSGVLKRIRKIGQLYEKFADVNYGFNEKKII